jgi:hypothetical protein
MKYILILNKSERIQYQVVIQMTHFQQPCNEQIESHYFVI